MRLLAILCAIPLFAQTITVAIRGTAQPWKNASPVQVDLNEVLDPPHTAIIICDMWDKHWCRGATERVNELAPRIARVTAEARKNGVLIIHAPSETMDFYRDAPQRKAIQSIARVAPPQPLTIQDAPLPIDDSKGGCDTPDSFYKAWTREHAAIPIAPEDLISDNGDEIYSALQARGIRTVLLSGVHTNMCVLNRGFAIKQLSRWGLRTILLRDLTDAMYNPADAPHVSHAAGTELVIQHIEKYWCPTMLSSELHRAFTAR